MTHPKSGVGFDNHWTLDGPERWPGLRVECERYVDTFVKGRSPVEWPAAFFAFCGYVIGKMEEEHEPNDTERRVIAKVRGATDEDATLLRAAKESGWLS